MSQIMERLAAVSEERLSELELAHLQIHQLQEELEALFTDSTETSAERTELQNKNRDLKATLEESQSELELALLQIHQLQEELEIYYQKYLQECRKPVGLQRQLGGAMGSDTLRVLRMARTAQPCGVRA